MDELSSSYKKWSGDGKTTSDFCPRPAPDVHPDDVPALATFAALLVARRAGDTRGAMAEVRKLRVGGWGVFALNPQSAWATGKGVGR